MHKGDKVEEIPFETFIQALENKNAYLRNGAIDYRIKTAEISLNIAKQVGATTPFADRQHTIRIVKSLMPHLDKYRVLDVSKFLNTVYFRMEYWERLPPKTKEELLRRREQRRRRFNRCEE